MKTVQVLVGENKRSLIPCQLKKIAGTQKPACSMACAFAHGCPVFFVDSHDFPITALRKDEGD